MLTLTVLTMGFWITYSWYKFVWVPVMPDPKSWMIHHKVCFATKWAVSGQCFFWPLVGVSSVWVCSRRRQADRLTVMSLDCNRESEVTAQTSDKTFGEKKTKQKTNWNEKKDGALPDDERQEAGNGPCLSNMKIYKGDKDCFLKETYHAI